ncbi:hypothetical protein SFR_0500 [Streptomyces sp. FR-008]|nr:hypothetical protein SFR_0500 [Streptomyces sp. FR-008]
MHRSVPSAGRPGHAFPYSLRELSNPPGATSPHDAHCPRRRTGGGSVQARRRGTLCGAGLR